VKKSRAVVFSPATDDRTARRLCASLFLPCSARLGRQVGGRGEQTRTPRHRRSAIRTGGPALGHDGIGDRPGGVSSSRISSARSRRRRVSAGPALASAASISCNIRGSATASGRRGGQDKGSCSLRFLQFAFEAIASERHWRRGLETRCRARGVIRADHSALCRSVPLVCRECTKGRERGRWGSLGCWGWSEGRRPAGRSGGHGGIWLARPSKPLYEFLGQPFLRKTGPRWSRRGPTISDLNTRKEEDTRGTA